MKSIGIITFHSSHNYGSVLQAYAMVCTMRSLGLQVSVIDYRHPKTIAMYDFSWWSKNRGLKANLANLWYRGFLRRAIKREQKFNSFINSYFPLTKRYLDYKEIEDIYDYLVCGSDQIWNPKSSGKNSPAYFLDFGDNNSTRFSYAASSGSQPFAKGQEEKYCRYLQKFKNIGVREYGMVTYIKEALGLSSTVNPDPTALITMEDWQKIEEPVIDVPEKYILVYSISNMIETVKFAGKVGKEYNIPVLHINPSRGSYYNMKKAGVISLNDISPGQFLWLFHHAQFVISNSFHGNMFSIIYQRPFAWYVTNEKDGRISTLHERLGLGKTRQVKELEDISKEIWAMDYCTINTIVDNIRKQGIQYIMECIS